MTQPPIVPGHQPPEPTPVPPARQSAPVQNRRVPATIVTVVLLLIASAVLAALLGMSAYDDGEPSGAFLYAVVAACSILGAVGSWRGWEVGRTLAVIVGAGSVLSGLSVVTSSNLAVRLLDYDDLALLVLGLGAALIGLVVVPQSSRDWFR